MIDKLDYCLERATADYVEMRHQRRAQICMSVRDGKMDAVRNGGVEGACARALVNQSWGFASTSQLGKDYLLRALEDATSLAKASKPRKKREVNLAKIEPHVDSYETSVKVDPRRASKEELVEKVIATDKFVRGFSDTIISDGVILRVIDDDLTFMSSEGAKITQRIVRCYGYVRAVAREKGNIVSAVESVGAQAGLEVFNETPLTEAGEIAAKRADKLVSARVPPAGKFPVILENKIVGLLAHEAVGHCSEADLVHSGSFLADKMDQKITSNVVTLVDDGKYPSGFGTMMYDDEGTPTEKTNIIEKGTCKSFLHSRETAKQFKTSPTGNARAWNFEFDPIIRMRNTYIAPGDYQLEELAEDIGEGYFLKGGLGGQADLTGEFMFGTQEAVKIQGGKFGKSYRGVTISGNAFDVLKETDAIGKDFVMRRGLCGKEQINFVGMGGASLRTRVLLGGR